MKAASFVTFGSPLPLSGAMRAIARIVMVSTVVCCLSVLSVLAQKNPKESAQVWLGLHAQILAASQYAIRVMSYQPGAPDLYYAWLTNYVDLNTPVQSPNIMLQVIPGRVYSMWVSCASWNYADVQFNVPPGYTLYVVPINFGLTPKTTIRTDDYQGGTGTYMINFELRPNDEIGLAPGYSRPPTLHDLTWVISLGKLSSGQSAGGLRWRATSVDESLFDAFSLGYDDPGDNEVITYQYSDGALKYVANNQVQIYIRRRSGTDAGYTIEAYSPYDTYSYPNNDPTQDWTFSESAFVTYDIHNPDSSWQGRVQITRTADGRTDTWTLSVNGGNTMLQETNSVQNVQLVSTANSPVSGETTEVATVTDASSLVASKTTRIYQNFAWGEELIQKTDDPDGLALTTTYEYYTSGWPGDGEAGKLKAIRYPDGSWIKYDYYTDFARWGELADVYQPWQDSGATDPDSATTSNCKVTTYSYVGERDIYQELPSAVETDIMGVRSAYSTTSYSFWNDSYYLGNGGAGSSPMRTETVQAYAGAGAALTTTRKVFHYTTNPSYAGYLYSQTNPNGTMVSASYTQGGLMSWIRIPWAWSATFFQVSTDGTGVWCDTYLYGTSTQATADSVQYTTDGMTNGKPIDPIWLVPWKSVRRQLVRDAAGNPNFEMTEVFTGSGFQLIGWKETDYSVDGLLLTSKDSHASTWSGSYIAGQLNYETDAAGTQTQYFFDDAMRVAQAERKGVGASGSYQAQTAIETYYTYDAANHVIQAQSTSGGLTLTTSSAYNLAGLMTSSTDQSGLSTAYAYANGGRTVTATLPGSATKITDHHLDGSLKSVTGTAVVGQYYSATVNNDGTITQTTYIGSNNSPRWSSVITDWLGRSLAESRPAPGNGTFTKSYTYNSAGQLSKTSETGLADTLYTYNGMGELDLTGLDVNQNGTLDLAGPDRVSEVKTAVVQENGIWWKQTLNYVYNQDNGNTPLLQSESLERLVPYDYEGTSYDDGIAKAEVDSYDLFRNLTVKTTVMNRPTATVTDTTTLPDSSVPEVAATYNGLKVSQQTAQNLTYYYQYDTLGRQTQAVDPRTGTTTTAYFTSGTGAIGQVSSVQDPAGDTTSYTYNSTDGRLFSETNALGKAVYHAYDLLGHEIETWGAATYPVSYTFDSYGQRVTMSTYRDGTSWSGSSWPGTGTPDTTTWSFDAATGVLLSKTDPASRAVSYTYNARSQLATRTWARGVTTTYAYDANTAEQTGIAYSDGTPSLSYAYNRLGRTATVGDASGTRTFAYSPTTTQLQTESVDSTFYSGRILTRDYDTTTTGAIGRSIGYHLGTSGSPSSDQGIGYGYDTYGRFASVTQTTYNFLFSYAYTANSNLIASMTHGGWVQNYTYESNRDNLSTFESLSGSTSIARLAYTLDALARRTGVVQTELVFSRYLNGGLHTAYGYNDRSEVTSGQTWQGSNPSDSSNPVAARNFGYAFDNIGNRASASVDGTADTYSANNLNQYTSRGHYPGVTVTGLAPASATVTINGNNASRQGDYYDFWIGLGNGSSSAWQSVSVNSSLGGNLTRNIWLPASPQAYTYDNDGNLTQDDRWAYTWDAENRLIAMETISAAYNAGAPRQRLEFTYDYLGRRAKKRVLTWSSGGGSWSLSKETRFLYDGWNLTAEYDSTSGFTLTRTYTWGLDISRTLADAGGVHGLLLESDITTGAQYLPAYDGNGNVLGLVYRSTGTLDAAYEYSPFGETLRATGTYAPNNPFRFSTKYTDVETGLVYYGCRYYNPALGRWLGRDPIEEKGGLSLYIFCSNDCINFWDILGNVPPCNSFGAQSLLPGTAQMQQKIIAAEMAAGGGYEGMEMGPGIAGLSFTIGLGIPKSGVIIFGVAPTSIISPSVPAGNVTIGPLQVLSYGDSTTSQGASSNSLTSNAPGDYSPALDIGTGGLAATSADAGSLTITSNDSGLVQGLNSAGGGLWVPNGLNDLLYGQLVYPGLPHVVPGGTIVVNQSVVTALQMSTADSGTVSASGLRMTITYYNDSGQSYNWSQVVTTDTLPNPKGTPPYADGYGVLGTYYPSSQIPAANPPGAAVFDDRPVDVGPGSFSATTQPVNLSNPSQNPPFAVSWGFTYTNSPSGQPVIAPAPITVFPPPHL